MIGHVGVCSWSLGAQSPEELAESLVAVGARGVQLALDPIRTGVWSLEKTRRALGGADVTMLSGMMATEGEDYSTLETIRHTGGGCDLMNTGRQTCELLKRMRRLHLNLVSGL